ncbi:Holin of 3TMs, for gene-transfer release [uncultured Caudovirales phage]|uniref:Holin of 3TMs, for gene-transfer release n=1 Tax=uncultured Caudovirales phage TaxID=2100421 RepID=A0A6J5M2N5_9CAUD|nr:Holin of 3TMs, for gene-transfer release [uncultured Caudovirales phage]
MAVDPISAVLDIGGKLIDRLWPDATQAAEAKLELLKMQQTGELAQLAAETELAKGQLEVNQAEAGSSNLFVAGWRPWIGWVCGVAFSYHFVVQPLLAFILAATGYPVTLPTFNMDALYTVLLGMLGLGSMRTFEKYKKVN